jgi:UDP-glucose 4-epimerase
VPRAPDVPGRRILITGVGSNLGAALARRLSEDPEVEHVAGLDTRRPAGLERFIEADVRDPEIAGLIPREGVDTVVHNQIVRRPGRGVSSRAMHDINVIGTLQLLTACERSPSIGAIVIRGSAGIYGSEPHAPQFFLEDMARLYPLRTRFQRDVGEIENLFQTYASRHEGVVCTMLRYQPAIGPGLDTQLTRYLSMPVVPTYLGFDPRLQFVHEQDGLGALVAAVKRPVRGAVNVASPGTTGLTRMIRRARRPSLPLAAPLFGPAVETMRRAGLPDLSPDFRRLVRYGRAVDTSRLVEEVGFEPAFSTPAALDDFLRAEVG